MTEGMIEFTVKSERFFLHAALTAGRTAIQNLLLRLVGRPRDAPLRGKLAFDLVKLVHQKRSRNPSHCHCEGVMLSAYALAFPTASRPHGAS